MTVPPAKSLTELLQRAFGFPSFRANQEEVCRAALAGRDVLLVMPTGSGKSLCYQLPALAGGGTALVISPLIALMEDQTAKLAGYGFPVARIHSGLERSASRQACIDYLNGRLRFLFVAPERFKVPGFAEMLAKRKPSLIAVDEAHCISQWGHDFRPDYRLFSRHLPALRPAPVMALTATATPVVQKDIIEQLGLSDPGCFIQGFRRDNLAIEVVEVPRPRRTGFTQELLTAAGQRPAIVYAPTRKESEALAAELSAHFPTAAYHAGLDPRRREFVQQQFLAGRLEVVVATIAFGMGIDKPDVRTVIHTALPGSLESYYQEIGRAGRDGQPSRTILMHSYADRRTHDFFFERDYPAVGLLDQIYRRLRQGPQPREEIAAAVELEAEVFDRALEKLIIHGGAAQDFAGAVTRGDERWRNSYLEQSERRGAQIELVIRFVESAQCRMAALVRHFGDLADGHRVCGHCDFCAPSDCVAQGFRAATAGERRLMSGILQALRGSAPVSTGRLHKQLAPAGEMSRNDFEEMLGTLARAELVKLENAVFEKDGKEIRYVKASLTRESYQAEGSADVEFLMRTKLAAPARVRKKQPGREGRGSRVSAPAHRANPALEEKLRVWRLAEARRLGVRAFQIFGDRTLVALAEESPKTIGELLDVDGIGPNKAERFGAEICRICSEK